MEQKPRVRTYMKFCGRWIQCSHHSKFRGTRARNKYGMLTWFNNAYAVQWWRLVKDAEMLSELESRAASGEKFLDVGASHFAFAVVAPEYNINPFYCRFIREKTREYIRSEMLSG